MAVVHRRGRSASGRLRPILAGLGVLTLGLGAVAVAGEASAAPVGPADASRKPRPTATARPPAPVVLAAAGDLVCDPLPPGSTSGDDNPDGADVADGSDGCRMREVGALVARARPAAFLPLGDTQYGTGSLAEYRLGYAKALGALLPITHPAVGNHEYATPGAAGYFSYFGARAGVRGKGWYSFDLGRWHLVALNSNCDQVDCGIAGEQGRWLRADLAAHRTRCTLAFWHHPRWSSGANGDSPETGDLVAALEAANADVILNGHDHDYERLRPLDAEGTPSRVGIREFVVGTGGKSLRPVPGSDVTEVARAGMYGAVFLTLRPTGYSWQFRTIQGKVADSGSAACH